MESFDFSLEYDNVRDHFDLVSLSQDGIKKYFRFPKSNIALASSTGPYANQRPVRSLFNSLHLSIFEDSSEQLNADLELIGVFPMNRLK